jgi:indole-3-glycerol phosphate synthase
MSDFLQQMATSSRERVVAARSRLSEGALLQQARATPKPPGLRPNTGRFDLIAELKLRSPALGQLKSSDEDIEGRVLAYAGAGAAAVSVLTEPSRFDGSMEHLERAAGALASLRVPAMRKDFVVDPYQVIEARAAGAGGVLVILRMLPRGAIRELLDCARGLGLFVLLEAFDAADLEVMPEFLVSGGDGGARHGASAAGDGWVAGGGWAAGGGSGAEGASVGVDAPLLAGLNCRDLATLQIVPERLVELAHLLPTNVPRVAESGVASADDAARVSAAGYDYALVGSALMRGGDPHALAAAMLKAGRSAK